MQPDADGSERELIELANPTLRLAETIADSAIQTRYRPSPTRC